jgi:hypothetical protein
MIFMSLCVQGGVWRRNRNVLWDCGEVGFRDWAFMDIWISGEGLQWGMAAPTVQNEPRRHHFVPQCWLAGFTSTGEKDGELYVTDLIRRKQWRTNPNKTGFIRDFYRVSEEEFDPVMVEKALARLEGEVAPLLRRTDGGEWPLSSDEFSKLLYFVAIQWARVPSFRPMIFKVLDDVTREYLGTDLTSKEAWLKRLKKVGIAEDAPGASYESMMEFYNSGEYSIKVQTEWYISQMFKSADHVFPTSMKRTWYMSPSPRGGFIGSDNPVLDGPKGKPIGFKNADIISYPLSKHIMLYSMLQPPQQFVINRKHIAHMNTICLMRAGQVFSPVADFCWMDEHGKVTTEWEAFAKENY